MRNGRINFFALSAFAVRSRDVVYIVICDMAHVNKLRDIVLRIAATVNSVKTHSCARYETLWLRCLKTIYLCC